MAIKQPDRRNTNEEVWTQDFSGRDIYTNTGYSNNLLSDTSSQFQRFPADIDKKSGNISSSVVFFFNSVEFGENTEGNIVNKNYTDWAGTSQGTVPSKNAAWQDQRRVSDLVFSQRQALEESEKVKKAGGFGTIISNFQALISQQYKRTDLAVHLLSPDSIQYSSGASWQDVNFELNALGLSLAVFRDENVKALSIMMREAGADATDLLGEGGDIAGALTKTIINPYTQQAFQGMTRRTFQFSWQLNPKNQAELNAIDNIISLFRFHMHPSISSLAGTGSNFLNFPGQVDIEWYFKDPENGELIENAWLPKISTCVIESVQTDYTPNGQFSFFKGVGAPTQINLSIQVKEIHPLSKSDVARGF